MADVRIDGADLIVEMAGLDKLWALRSSLTIPLANVRGATLDPGITRESRGIRTAGTHFPGVITAGSFRVDGERVFWDVRDPMKAVVIELRDEHYSRLIVEVDDPRSTIDLIEKSL